MKKAIITFVFICMCVVSFAQSQPKVGGVLKVKAPSGQFYNHIDFPPLNILVKRGKLASYKPVIDTVVLVEDVITKNDKTYVVLKMKDGSKFFGFQPTATANYQRAIDAGELVVVTP